MRDYIPEGEELTSAEKARVARSIPKDATFVIPNFIPTPDAPEERFLTRAEKEELATQKALEVRDPALEREYAKTKLRKLNAQSAVTFIRDLPAYRKHIFVQAEADDQARATILRRFTPYLAKEE